MQRLLLSTAMIAALAIAPALPVLAQTTTTETAPAAPYGDIAAPEGFVRQDIALTAADLLNATIYDTRGASVGEISDLVFAPDTAANGAATGTGTATTAPAPGTTTPGAGSAPDATTTTGGGMTTGAPATGDTSTTGTTADSAADADTAAEVAAATPTSGKISHAVLDVGGFLGMGEHRVAIPVSDLAVYRNDSETRVYLPWTEDQLRALPTYNPDDPATLGQPMVPAAN